VTLTVPSVIPESITAGDTVEFTQGSFAIPGGSAAPSDGWALSVRVIADPPFSATVTDDDLQTYTVTMLPALTEAIVTQTVARIVGYVTGSGDYAGRRYRVIDQIITIEPNPARATATNLKTHAERTLAIIEQAIEGTLPAMMSSYSIGGRAVTKYSPAELMGLRARYAYEVSMQRNGGQMVTRDMVFNERH
jgi:hypothetical protein